MRVKKLQKESERDREREELICIFFTQTIGTKDQIWREYECKKETEG